MPKLLIVLLLLSLQGQAQDIAPVLPNDSLLVKSLPISLGSPAYETPLLPDRMLFTQRIFWGSNGVLRAMNIAPLTEQGLQKETRIRRFMLVSHQATGYVTLAGFLMQAILAAKLNTAAGTDYNRLQEWQRTSATITNIAYGTTALLSLTAPPKRIADQKRASRIRLHRYLSIIHLTGFIATNVLASKTGQHAELRPYHQAAALTTLAAFAPALIALKF